MSKASLPRTVRQPRLPAAGSSTKLPAWLALAVAMYFGGSQSGTAATVLWDPDANALNNDLASQLGLGGAGTWNALTPNWWDPVQPAADRIWNNTAFDIAWFGGAQTTNSAVPLGSPEVAGGLIFTTGGYTVAPTAANTLTLGTAAPAVPPVISSFASATIGTSAVSGILGTQGLFKAGGGTLTVLGDNTGLSGPIIVGAGALTSSGNLNALGSGDLQLNFGTLNLLNNGAASSTAAPIAYSNNVIVNGNSTLNVASGGANTNNTISVASLLINNSQLTVTSANTYGFRVLGETTLGGAISTINTALTFVANNANATANMVAFTGGVVGTGALNKTGAGTVNLFGGNTYSGGTNIFAGAVTLANNTAKAGTGDIIVNPGAALAVTGPGNLLFEPGQTLALVSNPSSLGILRVDANQDVLIGSSSAGIIVSPYGASYQLNTGSANYDATGKPLATATYSQNIDLGAIGSTASGNGPIYLGASASTAISGRVTAANNVIRLAGAATTLTFNTAHQLTANNNPDTALMVGSPIGNVQTVTNGSGTFAITSANSTTLAGPETWSGVITVNRLATLQLNGNVPNPLGTATTLNILGGLVDTTATNYTGAPPHLGNTLINLYQGGTLSLNNTASAGVTDLRLNGTAVLNLDSAIFNFLGSNAPGGTSLQNLSQVSAAGGNTVNVVAGTGANADAELAIGLLGRVGAGTVGFTRSATVFGLNTTSSDPRVTINNFDGSGAAPVPVTTSTNGMIAPWLIDQTGATFLSYGANGIESAAFVAGKTLTTGGPIATDVVNQTAAAAIAAPTSVYALKVTGSSALTGAGPVTIASGGLIFQGAAAAVTNSVPLTFGAEAVVWNLTAQNITLSGPLTGTGFTKAGLGSVILTGANAGLTGTITLNQGTLDGNPLGYNFRPITLNAGSLSFDTGGNAIFLNAVTVNGDSTITAGDVEVPRIASLTVNKRPNGATDPIVLTIAQGLSVTGDTTLTGDVILAALRSDRTNDVRARVLLAGKVTGAGSLTKWNTGVATGGIVSLINGANDYTGRSTVNGGTLESLTATGTPFGTGPITVNPGGILRLAGPGNISGNPLTVNSDLNGLAVISVVYNGNPGVNAGLTSPMTFNNGNLGAPFSTILAIDAVGYTGAINLNTFANGTAFLGTTLGGNFAGALTPSTVNNLVPDLNGGGPTTFAGGVYRLGGGGTGFLNLTGAPNQLTGANAVQVGVINNVTQGASAQMTNGGQTNNSASAGAVQIVNLNNYTGPTILNGAITVGGITTSPGVLSVGNAGALGTSKIVFNGGGLQAPTTLGIPTLSPVLTLPNAVGFTGDALFYGGTNVVLTGPVALADNQTGVTRTINAINTAGVLIFTGPVTNGAGSAATNSLTKSGAGAIEFRGANTYTGYTNLNQGTVVVSSDTSISPNSLITFNGGALGAWNTSMTTSRDYVLLGSGIFDVGDAKTLTQQGPAVVGGVLNPGSNISGAGLLQKSGYGTMILNGVNSNNGTNAVQLNNGILQISANVNLGDPVANGQIVANGGTLRVDGTFTSNRVMLPNTNATTALGLNVTAGNTFTGAGVLNNNGTGIFSLVKTGAGTFVNNTTNSLRRLSLTNGIFQSSSATPVAAAASEVNLSGGTLFLSNLAVNQPVVTPLANYTGGAHLRMQSGAATSVEFNPATLNRFAVGTLVIEPGTSALGAAGNANAVRVIPTNLVLAANRAGTTAVSNLLTVANTADLFVGMSVAGLNIPAGATITVINSPTQVTLSIAPTVAAATFLTFGGPNPRANSLNNGIFPASIVSADPAGAANFVANNATTGFVPWDLATNATTTLSGPQPNLIGNITTPQTLTGSNSIYALRTNSDISGGTLRVGSVSSSQQGGVLVNATARIGTNLIFDPSSASLTAISPASGEGLFYVAPGATATLAGDVLANSFTKFGDGTVVFAGASNGILGALTVQDGTLTTTVAVPPTRIGLVGQNNRIIGNLISTADLQVGMTVSGTNVAAGAFIASIDSPNQITIASPLANANAAATSQTLTFGSSLFAGRIIDGATNKLTFVKNGAGNVILGGFSTAAPRAGDNTFTGGTVVNQGILQIFNPLALGGADGTTPGAVTLFGGTLDLRSDGGGLKGTIILGNPDGNGVNVNLAGPATINVDRFASGNIGNDWQINNLLLSENTLTVTGGNSYGLRVAGTTNIAGSYATIFSNTDMASGNLDLAGPIVGAGALNKQGGGAVRTATISGSANTYAGGTNVITSALQVTATSGTPLGTGRVNVFPGAILRVGGLSAAWQPGAFSNVAGQARLNVHGYFNSLGVVALDNAFDAARLLNPASFSNAYGTMGLGLGHPFFTQPLDLSSIGDGRAYLISALNTETTYVAANLIPGDGNGTAPRTYRLAGGVNNLAIAGVDNVLNDGAAAGTSLQVGSPYSIVGTGAAIGNTGNAVIIRNSNSFTGGTWIGKGSTLSLGVGGSPGGSTPLGSTNGTLTGAPTDVVIYGTLQLEARPESSFVNAATGKNANNYILRPGGIINLVDFPGRVAGNQDRWANTTANGGDLNLNGGSFQFSGSPHFASTETVGTFTVDKNSRILINRTADSSTSTLTVADLVRANNGILLIQPLQALATAANLLGIPNQATTQLQQSTGFDRLIVSNPASAATARGGSTSSGPGTINPGMAPGWIVDVSTNSFVTYNPTAENTGYQALVTTATPGTNGVFLPAPNQAGYSKVIVGAGAIAGTIALTNQDIVDISTTAGVTLTSPSTSVYALRTNRDVNPTAANNTLTIESGALISQTNTLILNAAPAAANADPLGFTLNFGATGAAEALIYTSSSMTINGQINAGSLTRFAPVGSTANLVLTGVNNLTGPVRLQQGLIQAQNTLSGIGTQSTGVFNNQNVILSGALNRDTSRLILDARVGNATTSVLASGVVATSQFGGTIFVNGDSRIDTNGGTVFQQINHLTFADLGRQSPVSLALGNVYVAGTTTLGANDNYIEMFFNGTAGAVLAGPVTGGTLTKFGNGTLLLANETNGYAGTVINEAGLLTATSIVGSLTRTGKPFGSGPITINPGGMLRLAASSNISSNPVSLKSSGVALGGLSIAYNSTAPISALFGAGFGKVNISTVGDYLGVIGIDINNYLNPLDMRALEASVGGKFWLGASIPTNYFNRVLTPGTDNVYRLGGGGSQGNLTIGGGSFENVLTGDATVQIGATTAGVNANGPAYINGNLGQVTLTNRNDVTGDVSINAGAQLTLFNAYALGGNGTTLANGTVYPTLLANGGSFSLNNTVSIPNPVHVVGDSFATSGGNNAAFTGEVKLADSDVGGTVTINAAGGGVLGLQGVISGASAAGVPGSNVIKAGAQTVVFHGLNTYRGTTSVTAGLLGIGSDVSPDLPGALGINDVPVVLTVTGGVTLAGQVIMDRGLIAAGTTTVLRGQSVNRSVFSGGIAITAGTLIIDQTSTSLATFRGGVLDVQGPISGIGALQIGNAAASTTVTNQGIVRLSANADGFGTSTVTGGITLQGARLQINSDTYFTGPANNPTILSGPLGTGLFTFGAGNTNAGGEIVAFGADRMIVNPLGNLVTAGDTILTFGGHNSLAFTRDLNINSDATLRNRTFNVLASQGVTTFSGSLSASGAAGGRLTKTGAGTLVLTGNNTFSGAAGTSLITVSAGVLEFSNDLNLGAVSNVQKNLSMGAASTLLLRGATPVTWTAAVSNRNLNLTAAGAGVDVRDAAGLLTIDTQVTGAFSLTKQGSGRLALNANNNAMTALIIGGVPAAAAANLPSGTTGGIVSTNATTGTPFSNAVTIFDGQLSLVGGAVAQNLTIGAVNYAGGSSLALNPGTTTTRLLATAFTRQNQGTLTIIPTAIANFGGSAQFDSTNNLTTTNGMLASPTVVVRDAATGALNFVRDTGTATGFALHNATTTASLAASAATSLADLGASTAVAAGPVDVYAVRTSANITATDATSQLRILNGGLIFNGNAAPNLSANTYFGNGTAPLEALVYTSPGLVGPAAAVISGGFTATDFTKSGLGDLLISGTGSVMAGTPTALRTMQINDGTVKFAGQSSLPSNGVIIVSPMDGAALDMNGQNLSIAALGGMTAATAATGRVINTGAPATLSLATRTGITSNFNGLISGNIAVVKDGIGTVTFGYNNEYTGGTTIGVGNITSASGVFTPLGTLQVNSFNSLGSGPVRLAGGILDIRNAVAGNEVQDNIDIISFGPDNGYNVVVNGLSSLGTPNTTSAFATTSTVAFQAINSLTFESNAAGLYALTTAGASANGVLVRGATTLAGDTILNVAQQIVFGGRVAAASGPAPTITKIGASTLFLTNTDRGASANAVGRWNVFLGNIEARMSQGGSNPLTNGSTIQLNTTGSLQIRHDGDNLTDPQVLSDFATNTVQIGSLAPVSSPGFLLAPSTNINLGSNSLALNKTIQFKQLQFGGPLGTTFLSSNPPANNGYTAEFVNGLTMIKDAYLSLNTNTTLGNFTISGQLSGNGTLFKQGAGELDINTVATNTGGTVLAAGDTFFGSFLGQTRALSTTAKLGPGNITIQSGGRLRFNALSNLNGSQLVDVRSNLNSLAVVGIAENAPISRYNIRAPFGAGVFSNSALTAPSTGSGLLALNTLYDATVIDLARLGDGTWYLGSTSNGSGITVASSLDGRYNSAQLLPGAAFNGLSNANPAYRLGGGGGTLYIGLAQPGSAGNQLFGNANVVVGAGLTSGFGGTVGNGATAQSGSGSAGVIFNQEQAYTGSTLVNRGSQLEFRGAMATSGYDVFGILVAGGTEGTFAGGPTPIIRPGGQVNLDNQFDLQPLSATQGRWGNATTLNLDSGVARVIGNSAADLREVIGQVTVAGGSTLTPQRTFANRLMEINVAGFARLTNLAGIAGNNGQLSIEGTTAAQLGSDERVTLAGGNFAAEIANIPGGIANGMVAPWMYNGRDVHFLTYSDFGFVNSGFTRVVNGALLAANSTATDRTLVSAASTMAPGVTLNAYALRADSNITLATLTDTTARLVIASGGLLTNTAISITPAIVFGSPGSPGEGIIANNSNLVIGATANTTTSGQLTASSIAKAGGGSMFIDAEQGTFSGTIAVNAGALFLRNISTGASGATTSTTGGLGGTIVINGANSTLSFRSDPTFVSAALTATATTPNTATLPNVTGLAVGQVVTGTGTTAGVSYITNITGNTVTVSNAAFTGTPALTFTAYGITFNNSVAIGAGNPIAVIEVNRAFGTTIIGRTNSISGDLIFGGAPGEQGQQINISGTNLTNYLFQVNGTTNLGPVGNAGIYTNITGGNAILAGKVTGAGTLVKSGAAQLSLGLAGFVPTVGNDYSGGTVLNGGTLAGHLATGTPGGANSVNPVIFNAFGSGDITLSSGALTARVDLTNNTTITQTAALPNNVIVVGNSTINSERITLAGGSNKTISYNSLTMVGGQTLTIGGLNGFRTQFNAVAPLISAPTFVTNADMVVRGRITDLGAGLPIIKNGAGTLWLASNANDFSGGLFINNGILRFGVDAAENFTSINAKAGTGNITVNPNGQIFLLAPSNINTALGQQVDVRSVPQTLGVFRTQSVFSQAALESILTPTSSGLLVAGIAQTIQPLDLAKIGDGTFQFANAGDFTYTPTEMGAGAGNVYRLGGNAQNFRITVANPDVLTDVTTPTPGRTTAGPARVQIGSLGSGGGTFVFNTTNSYSGGTTIVRGITAQWSTSNALGGTDTPLGTGRLEVFGTAQAVGAGGVGTGGLFNQGGNVTSIHPGANITIDKSAATTAPGNTDNRWGGGAIALDGATFQFRAANFTDAISTESFTDLTFSRGTRINTATISSTAKTVINVGGNFTRANNATMVFQPSSGALLGAPIATANAQQFLIATGGQQPPLANGMAPAYLVDGTSNQFVTYGTNGFADVPYTASALNLPAGLTAGTAIAQVTGNVALADNPVIYALGITAASTISNGFGQFNTITLDGAGATPTSFGGIITNGAVSINANVKAGTTGQFELPIFVNGATTTQLSGDISAAGVTKFGAGVLQINQDQSDLGRGSGLGYTSGWTVNEGSLTANVFGALGNAVATNTIKLNGSAAGAATLFLRAISTQVNTTYTSGKITAVDNAVIDWSSGLNDVVNTISDVDVVSTGGTLLEAQLRVNLANSRAILRSGQLSVSGANAGAIINIVTSASANGTGVTNATSSGLSVASLAGAADTRLVKWGQGILYVRGDSAATFGGAVNIEQGAVQINHPMALGSGPVTVKRYGVLDINTTGYTGAPVYLAGSIERWTSDNARSGAVNLGGGTLQIANDQTLTTANITMNGGSIEGYLRFDDLLGATQGVYRTIGSNVRFNLAGDSLVGQGITEGNNGLDLGRQANITSPLGNTAAGVILEIKGNISGPGGLTKQGHDTVTLSGANTYGGGTSVKLGTLRAGAANALPATGLSTTGAGVFDLNGFDQSVGRLTSPAPGLVAASTNLSGSGYVTNSATSSSTVTVSGTVDAVYGGIIQQNVALTKSGTNVQTLTNTNTYYGITTIKQGDLRISMEGNIGATPSTLQTNQLTLDGGRLHTTASFALSPTRGVTVTAAGGTFLTDPGTTLTVNSPVAGAGTGPGLIKDGANSSLILNGRTGVSTLPVTAAAGTVRFGPGNTTPGSANHHLLSLQVNAGALASFTAEANQVLETDGLSIASTGRLDLRKNALIVDFTGTSSATYNSVRDSLRLGYRNGFWDGPGISSSSIFPLMLAGEQPIKALGVLDDRVNDEFNATTKLFRGVQVPGNAVLVRLTYYGDTNLDGRVTSDDYGNVDQAYQALHDGTPANDPPITWFNGDFNYDGTITGADFDLMDNAYQFQDSTPLFTGSEMGDPAVAAVPEPASAALLGMGALLLGFRRRRK
jgi:autotransporter-associated beta strand protein